VKNHTVLASALLAGRADAAHDASNRLFLGRLLESLQQVNSKGAAGALFLL
jgi:hypothetical protein